jgi:anaerobic magnesium-protoporphyrin IX monomethyl ester cyclase
MVRFLWINAIQSLSEVETRYPNLGIGYLSASLKGAFGEKAFQFKVVDSAVAEAMDTFKPHVVGISCVSQNYNLAKEYAKLANERGMPALVGGVHISFLPRTLTPHMTVGCIGEGELAIVDLMQLYIEEDGFPADKLCGIQGIVFHDEEGLIKITPPREMCHDLDILPIPDFAMVKSSAHAYLFTSRGCPYRCNFCASSRFWNEVRFFSAERVVSEIELLVNQYNSKFISFFDDLFVANKKRFFRIVDILEEKGLVGRAKFSCSLRANTVNEDIVKGLKRMGVVSVGMGLESGNQRVLEWLKGSGITVEHNRQAVSLLNKYGIMPNASFVIGSPDETRAEILETLKFIKEIKPGLFDVYVLTPFPGTPVWDLALKKKLVSEGPEMDWSSLNVNFDVAPEKAVILSSLLSRSEIVGLYRKFGRYRLFHNAKRVWNHPMLMDLPRYLLKRMREKILRKRRGVR